MIWNGGPDKLATFFNKGWLEFTGRAMQELGFGWASGLASDQRDECLAGYSISFDYRRTRACGVPIVTRGREVPVDAVQRSAALRTRRSVCRLHRSVLRHHR